MEYEARNDSLEFSGILFHILFPLCLVVLSSDLLDTISIQDTYDIVKSIPPKRVIKEKTNTNTPARQTAPAHAPARQIDPENAVDAP